MFRALACRMVVGFALRLRRTAPAGEPFEGRLRGALGLVLQADPAVITFGLEQLEVPLQPEPTGARLMSARRVGDLHVPDPGGMRRDDVIEVLTVDCQVVEVAPVSYTHLRAHETRHDIVCRLLLEKTNV